MVGGWPLVGRNEELGVVLETLRGNDARGVVIAGALGVGKTRLAREAVAALECDFSAEWVSATPASRSIPFGALAHLLPDIDVLSTEDRLRLVRGITATLDERYAGRPLIVAVDDAQWLDTGAAALVHQLAVTGRARLLLTVRTDEPVPDAIVACWKDGLTERLELQPLGTLDLDALVPAALDRPVDRATLQRFWTLSKGNPLFVHELVVAALETDAFTVSDGVWSWTGDYEPSTRLSEILESRLAHVSAPGRAVLDHLAVGEPLRLETLTDLCSVSGVVEAERAGLAVVFEREDDEVRLFHPLYGEALRAAMGTVERRRIMIRLADAMAESASSSRAQRLRVAAWRLESGTPAPERVFSEAAEIANAVFDHRLAERLARRAVAEGGGFRASLALGEALTGQGRAGEGLAVLEPLAAQADTDREHVAVAIARYFGLTSRGFRPEFEDVLLSAERQVRDPQLLSYLRAQRATLLCLAGRIREGVALLSQGDGAGGDPDEITELRAVTALGTAWTIGGKPETACALGERMLEPALRHREELPHAPAWVVSMQLPALVTAGRLDEAEAATDFVEAATASGTGSADGPSFFALVRGMSALQRGLAQSALRWLRESVAGMRTVSPWRLPFPLVQLTEACALLGDGGGAAAASAEADELVVGHGVLEGLTRRARGWAALAQGQRSTAVDLFNDAADWSSTHEQYTAALFALHDALRLGSATDAISKLIELAPRTEGRWAPCFAAHAVAVRDDDGAGLEQVATDFEAIGARLLAAEAVAEASAAFHRSGRKSQAERAAARAGVLAAACEGARTPRLEELERPLPLTRREREIANLAAEGLASQAIADRLFVSVRTVEGHLHKAYGKLGVSERRGLARVLKAPSFD